jgi:general stress protein 26
MDRDQDIAKLAGMIKDIQFAMLTTRAADGTLRSRPMTTRSEDFDGTLWFLTGERTHKTSEIALHPDVNLAYVKVDDNAYVSVSGRAQVLDDRERARALWNPAYRAWFPGGVDDPDLRVLRVDVTGAEYWDSPSSTVVQALGFAKAIFTGQRYEPGEGEHGKI